MTAQQISDPREFVQYVIAAIDANPDLREPLLRALLTEEFLQVPTRLDNVSGRLDDVSERLDDVSERLDDVSGRLDDVSGRLDDVSGRLDDVSGRLDDVSGRLARVEDDVKTLKDDMGRVKGLVLEKDFADRATSWLNREFGFFRNRVVHGATGVFPQHREEFLDAVADAQSNGLITPEQTQRLSDTDLIVQCRRFGDTEPTWVAVEIAARIDEDDINRALRSAEALRVVFGEESLPVVAGERIDPPDVERARQSGVTVISIAE